MNYLISPYHDKTLLIYYQKWFIQTKQKIISLDTSNIEVIVNLYPFLEHKEEYYLTQLDNIEAINSFPYKEIIHCGLMQNTDFWVGCSINWLSQKSISDWIFFDDYLRKIISNKGFSQKTRQLTAKMIKNIDHMAKTRNLD